MGRETSGPKRKGLSIKCPHCEGTMTEKAAEELRLEAMRAATMAMANLQCDLHALGLHVTAHVVNHASRAIGWEFQGDITRAARAGRGEDVNG